MPLARLDLARRPNRGPASVVCDGCGRRLPDEPHADGCHLADVLTPAYLARVRELARPVSLEIPGPRRGDDGGQS